SPYTWVLQIPAYPTAPYAYLDDHGKVPLYRCPSVGYYDQYAPHDGSSTSYAANYLLLGTRGPGIEARPAWYAVYGSKYRLGNVPDGTSNTVLLGEKNTQVNQWTMPCFYAPIYAALFGAVLNPSGPYPYTYWGQFTTDGREPPLRDV